MLLSVFLFGRASAGIVVSVQPGSQITTSPGSAAQVAISVSGLGPRGAQSIGTFDFDLAFDPALLSFVGVNWGTGLDVLGLGDIRTATASNGLVNLFELSLDSIADLNELQPSAFLLASVDFIAIDGGISRMGLTINALGDSTGASLPSTVVYGSTGNSVPEPSSAILLLVGALALLVWSAGKRRCDTRSRHTARPRTVSLLFAACVQFVVPAALASEDIGSTSAHPAMAPNGQEIVFSSDAAGTTSLWLLTASTGTLRRLTANPAASDDFPSWSPDGSTIAFTSRRNNVKDVWLIGRDGSNQRQLTSNVVNNFQPTWSPDGTRIAFVSDRAGTNDLWVMNADGTNQLRLTSLAGEESEPSFSPAGDQVVFVETTNGSSSLMTVNVATRTTRVVTGAGFNDWHPSWSTGGIVFASDRVPNIGGNSTIWLVQADGSGLRQFANVLAMHPSWSVGGDVLFTDEARAGVAAAGISSLSSGALLPSSFNGDLNGDGIIDLKDVAIVQQGLNTVAGRPFDPRDRNQDGKIDALDVRLLTNKCTYERCASNP